MQLGIIEGFYGESWGWQARHESLEFLSEQGFSFFLYAPKSDSHLRKRWRKPHGQTEKDALISFGNACREHGLKFGVGFSPYALHEDPHPHRRSEFQKRLNTLKSLNLDILAILFDDMKGDFPHLARVQSDILKQVADSDVADRLIMCPTYYSDHPILDRLFGPRPEDYLMDLGRMLDDRVDVFWTGPEICSKSYSNEHLQRVYEELGRRPLLWDNYPVNDGPRMSRYLHLGAPERGSDILPRVSGVAINPMNQPWLSRIPLNAMAQGMKGKNDMGEKQTRSQLTQRSIRKLFPAELAENLCRDWQSFQDSGLDGLSEQEKTKLLEVYGQLTHPAAKEVTRWLTGEYLVSKDILTDS